MNMHCASRLGWTRSAREASCDAPAEAADPAQADMIAASGRAPAGAGIRASRVATPNPRTPARHPAGVRPRRSLNRPGGARPGLFLFVAAALLLIPGFVFADVPVATISGPEVVVEGDQNPTDVPYTVTLADATGSADIVIDYTVTGTATEALDYTKPSGKMTIGGDSSGTFVIQVLGDDVDEVGETMIVTLTDASTAAGMVVLGSPKQVTTMIRHKDTRIVTVTTPAVTVDNEGAEIVFTASVPDGDSGVTISYATADASATAGADYTAKSRTLSVAANGEGMITIATKPDTLSEGTEQFELQLSLVNPADDVALGNATIKGTIDDRADNLTFNVANRQGTVREGSEAATFVVTLSRAAADDAPGAGGEPVVVNYSVMSDESPDDEQDDYEEPDGMLTIPAGMSSGEISIMTLADDLLEGDEVLTLTVDSVTVGTRAVTPGQATTAPTTIADSGRKVTVSVADITVNEDEDAVFTISLSGEVSSAVTVQYDTADDSAAGSQTEDEDDYTSALAQNVTIPQGMTAATFTVTVNEDDLAEGDETFTVMLSNLSTTASSTPITTGVALRKDEAIATIRDLNALSAIVEGPDTVPEGSMAEYTVMLYGGTGTADVEVDYSVGGTATPDVDYTDEGEGKLTIPAEAFSATISIETKAVSGEAAGETMVLTLTNVSTDKGTASIGTPNSVTTVFTHEDTLTVSLSGNQTTVNEGSPATFTVTMAGPSTTPTQTVVADYTVAGQVTAGDYTDAGTGKLTFANTDTDRTKTITLTATADEREEADETFSVTLSLSGQPADVRIGTPTARTTIEDQDDLMATVVGDQESVTEGVAATFTVTLDGGAASSADVVVRYKVGGEVTSDDYTAPSGSLTIPAGTATGVITIPTVDDTLPETAEDLTITLTGATTGAGKVELGAVTTATVPILESDGQINVSVRDAGSVTEGANATFLVELNGTVSADLPVNFTVANGTATSGTDFTATTTSPVTIEEGTRSATITVATEPDSVAEENETFTVTLNDTGLSDDGVIV